MRSMNTHRHTAHTLLALALLVSALALAVTYTNRLAANLAADHAARSTLAVPTGTDDGMPATAADAAAHR